MAFEADFDVGFGNPFHGVAEFLNDELGGVGVQHVGRADEFALLHHEFHDVGLALAHAVRKVSDRDRFRQHDFARDFLACAASHFQAAITLALAGAFHGSVGALFFLVIPKGRRDGQPALTAFGFILACGADVAAPRRVIAAGLHAFDAAAEFAQRRQIIRIERDKRTRPAAGAAGTRATWTAGTIA